MIIEYIIISQTYNYNRYTINPHVISIQFQKWLIINYSIRFYTYELVIILTIKLI